MLLISACVCVFAWTICVSFWPRQQNQSRMTPVSQIPLFSLVKLTDNLPFPTPCFQRNSHVLWVPALHDHIWSFLLLWVGGCVASKKSVVKSRNIFLFAPSFIFWATFTDGKLWTTPEFFFFCLSCLRWHKNAVLYVFFPVHLIPSVFHLLLFPFSCHWVAASRWCAF